MRFLEDGRDRGSIRFHPTDGFGKRRRIIAAVEQDGAPRTNLTVAHYVAPPTIRPGRPGRIRISRRGSRVTVRWGAAKQADSYRVLITGSDGRRELRVTSSRHRRFVLRRILPRERLKIIIRGQRGPAHRTGPARRARLKAKPRGRGRR